MNELVMILQVAKGDPRLALVQSMEDLSVDEVVGIRDCIITSKPYPMVSFRDSAYPRVSLLPGMTPEECKAVIFQQGRLVCRCVQISIVESSGKSYGGEARTIYAHESDSPAPTSSSGETIIIDSDNEDDFVIIDPQNIAQNRNGRSESARNNKSRKSKMNYPTKKIRYTFADVFCGAGGASQGAVHAGLHVLWGLDKDQAAIQAYNYNHAGAEIFLMDAHDFPPPEMAKTLLRVDILHLSPPCCYWSPAQ
jgi:DNA (cytosine-5)-methyltransferase 1